MFVLLFGVLLVCPSPLAAGPVRSPNDKDRPCKESMHQESGFDVGQTMCHIRKLSILIGTRK